MFYAVENEPKTNPNCPVKPVQTSFLQTGFNEFDRASYWPRNFR